MNTKNEHWDSIFSTTSNQELGWYESDVSQTLKFLDLIPSNHSSSIFLPGAGTSTLVDQLITRGHKIILNDISDKALSILKRRVGTNEHLTWLHHDISTPLPKDVPQVDIWIDRAVLHFLLEASQIERYFSNLSNVIRQGGYVLLAEFSTIGAPQCAGLELHRYSLADMQECLGKVFTLVEHEEYTYMNPSGDERPYIYALFKKTNG